MTTLLDYAAKVKEMREAQKKFFKTNDERLFELMEKLERELDVLTSEILEEKENNQMKLL